MSNIIDSIQVSGTVYQIQGSGGGNNVIELTQAQYDALVDKDPNTFYIITDAAAVDLANYYTKSETSGATQISTALNAKADTATTYTKTEVDTALGGKQATLVSGTNIKTINNESILGSGNIDIQGGGGKAVVGGRYITVTSGETADTVSFNLEIGNLNNNNHSLALNGWVYGTGSTQNSNTESGKVYNTVFLGSYNKNDGYNFGNSEMENIFVGSNNQIKNTNGSSSDYYLGHNIVIGQNNNITGSRLQNSVAIGYYNSGATSYSLTCGYYNKTSNIIETSFGSYNNSVSASTTFGDSGNTLFSVGNGTANNARHNAFEIRQNGDIYFNDGANDVKLQDKFTTIETIIGNINTILESI